MVAIVVVGRRLVVRERRSRRAVIDAALAASPGVALFFERNRRVIAANDGVARHAGGDPVGRLVVDALGVGDDPIARGVLDDLMTKVLAGETTYAELSDEDDDGSMRILEVEGHSVTSEKPLGFLQVIDATERRGRAMRSAQSERMEALGALAGGLAHDFNNLLFVTLGNLQLMAMNEVVADDEKLSKFVSRSMSAVERGAEITKSLLAVARSQPLEETTVSVNELVKEMICMKR